MIKVTGIDPNGIKRFWAEGETKDIAQTRGGEMLFEYLKTRPDLAPPSKWSFDVELTNDR